MKKEIIFGVVFVFVMINVMGVMADICPADEPYCRRGHYGDSSCYCFDEDPDAASPWYTCTGGECIGNICAGYITSFEDSECMYDYSRIFTAINPDDESSRSTQRVQYYKNFSSCDYDDDVIYYPGYWITNIRKDIDITYSYHPNYGDALIQHVETRECCKKEETPCQIIFQFRDHPDYQNGVYTPPYLFHQESVCCAEPTPACVWNYDFGDFLDFGYERCYQRTSTDFNSIEQAKRCSVCSDSVISDDCETEGKTSCCYGDDCYNSDTHICYGNECFPLICKKTEKPYDSNEDGHGDSCCENRNVDMSQNPPNYGSSNIADTNSNMIDETCCDSETTLPDGEYIVKPEQIEPTALNPNGYACVPFSVGFFDPLDLYTYDVQKEFCAECKGSGSLSDVSESCESNGKVDCLYNQCYNGETEIVCGNKCFPVGEEPISEGFTEKRVADCCDVDGDPSNGEEKICNGDTPYCTNVVTETVTSVDPLGEVYCDVFSNYGDLEDDWFEILDNDNVNDSIRCARAGCTWNEEEVREISPNTVPGISVTQFVSFGTCSGEEVLCSDVGVDDSGEYSADNFCPKVGCSFNPPFAGCVKLVNSCEEVQEKACVACTQDIHCNPFWLASDSWTKSCCKGEGGEAKCIDKATEVCCGASGCGRVHNRTDWPVESNGICYRLGADAELISSSVSPKPELWLQGPHDAYNEIGTVLAKDIRDSYMAQGADGTSTMDLKGLMTITPSPGSIINDISWDILGVTGTGNTRAISSSVSGSIDIYRNDGISIGMGLTVNTYIGERLKSIMISPGKETVVIGTETHYQITDWVTWADRVGNIRVTPIYTPYEVEIIDTVSTPPGFENKRVTGMDRAYTPTITISKRIERGPTIYFMHGKDFFKTKESVFEVGMGDEHGLIYYNEYPGQDATYGARVSGEALVGGITWIAITLDEAIDNMFGWTGL